MKGGKEWSKVEYSAESKDIEVVWACEEEGEGLRRAVKRRCNINLSR